MYIYIFTNPLLYGEARKIVMNFPMPIWMTEQLVKEGWHELNIDWSK